ncbi:diguanylate cyclase [Musicola paradisiaca]|uniref:diguanylate cyclase n=1 Tax=Musicola paradisiaca (strain Ech703) TaxID=579405 RepID=C6CCW8_MUSP7|nr:diguanylate cyclase [Musicola paradisiaca]ACS85009.1 diguanylate cyclase [Musicola paradisiaca Ech703]
MTLSSSITYAESERRRTGLAFARRVYMPRAIGLGLGFFYVAAALYGRQLPVWAWGLLVAHGFLWPHIAYLVSSRARDPMRREYGNLLIDAAFGGIWIGVMGLNGLPSVLIMSMMGMNNIAAGGLKLFLQGLGVQVLCVAVFLLLIQSPINTATTTIQLYFCLPMLFIYPISVGLVTYRTAMKLAEHKRRLKEMSIHDGMTRLYNRQHWEQLLQNEFDICARYQRVATLALLDVDHFKTINDNFGHHVGDDALLLLSNGLKSTLRQADIIGRFGGDEFGIVFPETRVDEARLVVERLREYLESVQLHHTPLLRIGISAGLVQFSSEMSDHRAWMRAADMALYQAKNRGRGCSVCVDSLSAATVSDERQTVPQ